MQRIALLYVLAVAMLAAGGCRNKGWESFTSATEVNSPLGGAVGDQYANGGIGPANGGQQPDTLYGKGADVNSKAPVNNAFDQPSKGSGRQPGELPNIATPGNGLENGPAMQPNPSDQAGDASMAHG